MQSIPSPEVAPPFDASESKLVAHAQRELHLAGLYESDADYGPGATAKQVLDLVTLLASQRHSGGSHGLVMDLFTKLAHFKPLTPITNDPAEWEDMSAITGQPFWQNRRYSSAMSTDGGKTHFLVDAEDSKQLHVTAPSKVRPWHRWMKIADGHWPRDNRSVMVRDANGLEMSACYLPEAKKWQTTKLNALGEIVEWREMASK